MRKNRRKLITVIITLTLFSCCPTTDPRQNMFAAFLDETSFFYLDIKQYPDRREPLPIGVFDSGTGGLTVLEAIVTFDEFDNRRMRALRGGDGIPDFKNEFFIYLGDQANMPYGNYPAENKTDLLREHILKDVQFLLGTRYYPSGNAAIARNDKLPVKAIVIACNTATAYGAEDCKALMAKTGLHIKVIGVIDAGVRAALSSFRNNEDGSIGVIATAGTVSSSGYPRVLKEQLRAMQYAGTIEMYQQAGRGLAGAIDGIHQYIDSAATTVRRAYRGPSDTSTVPINVLILPRYNFDWKKNRMLFEGPITRPRNIQINSIENYISYHLVSLLEKIRTTPGAKPLKAIILGCTHYPFFKQIFQKKLEELSRYREGGTYLYRPLMNRHIELIDPAQTTARELYEYLLEHRLLGMRDPLLSEFYLSVPNLNNRNVQVDDSGNFTYAYKYGRTAGILQEYVKRVPISKRNLSSEIIQRLQKKVPSVFALIRHFTRKNGKTSHYKKEEKI
jgi:glutamate racemase